MQNKGEKLLENYLFFKDYKREREIWGEDVETYYRYRPGRIMQKIFRALKYIEVHEDRDVVHCSWEGRTVDRIFSENREIFKYETEFFEIEVIVINNVVYHVDVRIDMFGY
ncbi:MAG: hypothetical protein ACTSYS_13930 [Promethearchaeota archaeon]